MKTFGTLKERIEQEYQNIEGIMIYQNQNLLYEHYFNGSQKDTLIHVASIAKSITSLCIGIAIDQQLIPGVDTKVMNYFPEYKIKKNQSVLNELTLKHFLTMSVPYKTRYEPYTKVYSSDDWTQAVLSLIGGKEEIGTFHYVSASMQILSSIIMKVSGLSLRCFANEFLLKPLDIQPKNTFLIPSKEEHLNYVKTKGIATGWIEDPKGISTGGWGIPFTTEELSKIGMLCLQGGKYQGKQIISKSWIEESTKIYMRPFLLGKIQSYGYLWWIESSSLFASYHAIGDSGNILSIYPSLNLVVAITSSFNPRAKDRIKFIEESVIPLLENN